MDLYTIFKYLHVVTAIAWVGGGVTIIFLAIVAKAGRDEAMASNAVAAAAFLGTRWFIPTSSLTVVFGVVMAFLGNLWGEAWVVLGLAGFAASFLAGFFGIKPASEKIVVLRNAGQIEEARAIEARLLQISKFDYALLFVVIFDMVFKPGWGDVLSLGIMALVLVVAAALFLRPGAGRLAAA